MNQNLEPKQNFQLNITSYVIYYFGIAISLFALYIWSLWNTKKKSKKR